MPKLPQVLLATAAALCAVDAASGQGLRRLPASKAEGQQFGSTLAALGDLDGDGSSELAVGAQRSGPGQPGFVSVLSGTNGRVLYTLHGLLRDDRFGRSLSGGLDLDGDAVPDLVVGALDERERESGLPSGYLRAYSGWNGSLLWQVDAPSEVGRFAYAVALLPDVSGDGLADVAVTAPEVESPAPGALGCVIALSGRDGSQLWHSNAENPRDRFGVCLARGGDFDGDGLHDLLVGAPGSGSNAGTGGSVFGLSGANGAVLFRICGTLSHGEFGSAVAAGADLDGDGREDFIVGSVPEGHAGRFGAQLFSGTRILPFDQRAAALIGQEWTTSVALLGGANAKSSRYVLANSSTAARSLWIQPLEGEGFFAPVPTAVLGGAMPLCAVPDLDGDGTDELALGLPLAPASEAAPNSTVGEVRLLSGSSGRPLWSVRGELGDF